MEKAPRAPGGPTVFAVAVLIAFAFGASPGAFRQAASPQHFIFFDRERERIHDPGFLRTVSIAGAQLKYTWRELEPEKDRYALQPILDDVAILERHGKRLFVQLQDVSFDANIVNVPDYLRTDPAFGGGVAMKYDVEGSDESKARPGGWVARRWDPAVRARLAKLLHAMGESLDGRIEGITLAETSIGFGETGRLHPSGFTYAGYIDGVKALMSATRDAFPRSVVIEYANFMPGEWLPADDRGYLRAIYEHAARIGAGVGGPDLLPHRRGQLAHSYPLIAGRPAPVKAGIAVQSGNLGDRNPVTGTQVSVGESERFARERLHVDYMFWGTEEPYYSRDVLPYLRGLGATASRE